MTLYEYLSLLFQVLGLVVACFGISKVMVLQGTLNTLIKSTFNIRLDIPTGNQQTGGKVIANSQLHNSTVTMLDSNNTTTK